MHVPTASTLRSVVALTLAVLAVPLDGSARVVDEMGERIGAKRLAAGAEGDHTCLVRADGNVLCWGNNASGQIGDATSGNIRNQPTLVSGITTAVAVAAGTDHSCALLSTGAVQCWGSNAFGQLGVGSTTAASAVPLTVPGLSNVVSISAGTRFTCARRSDGTVRCWGTNQFGQLGDDTNTTPRFLPVTVANLNDAVKIAAGATHVCALRAGGVLACWGGNGQGQLGDGTTSNRDVPVAVVGMTDVVALAAGLRFTCAVRSGGSVSCWGDNDFAQLGTGATSDNSPLAVAALNASFAVDIAAGERHVCYVIDTGAPLCWGGNDAGQLGNGTTAAFEPSGTPMSGLDRPLEVTAARRHGCSLAGNDVVRCWGDNALGQLGNLATAPALQPTAVIGVSGSVSARRLAIGTNHSCAVRADGTGACWGRNDGGAIGDGTVTDRLLPTALATSRLSGFQAFITISGGGSHNCGLAHHQTSPVAGHAQICWGDNRNQQASVPADRDFVLSPEFVAPGGVRRGMSAGSFHTCGADATARATCFGLNSEGQLGSTDAGRSLVSMIGGFVNVAITTAGDGHSCVLLADGRIFCWGSNAFGQLGNGTRIDSAVPRQAGGISNAVSLASARDHNCALLASGVLLCWGRNDFGQVDGTLGGDRLVPTAVGAVAAGAAVAVRTGFQHTCILTPIGIVRCWGRNNNGQLGNNTTSDSLTPVTVVRSTGPTSVVALANVVGLVSDAEHNCALRASGQPFCWGRNPEGQLGDGTRTRRLLATPVGSFVANIAGEAQLGPRGRTLNVVVLVNCPAGERFNGHIAIAQGATHAHHPFTGGCTGGLSQYPFAVPAQGREGFAAGEATAELEIVVRDQNQLTDAQVWARRIVVEP